MPQDDKPTAPISTPIPVPQPQPDKPNPDIIPPPLESVNYAEVFEIGETLEVEINTGFETL